MVDKHLGNVMLIDVAIPSDFNVVDKEAEKIKDLIICSALQKN